MSRFLCVLVLASSSVVWAQSSVKLVPDCVFPITLDVTGRSPALGGDNRSLGCNAWVVEWENAASDVSFSIRVQSAPTVGGSAAGSWSNYIGTVESTGCANPCTENIGTMILSGYVPWISANVTAGVGNAGVRGRIIGWKFPVTSSGGGGGGSVTVTNFPSCFSDAAIVAAFTFASLSSGQLVVNPSGSTQILVCGIAASWDNSATMSVTQGTGAGCVTGTGNLAVFGSVTNFALTVPFKTAAGQGLCISPSVAATGGGQVIYVRI